MDNQGKKAKSIPQSSYTTGNTVNVSSAPAVPVRFNAQMQPHDSLPAQRWQRALNVNRAVQIQKNPFSDPTQISRGITSTTGGGSFTLYDKTGGTALFSYNPSTGVITINGSLVSNVVNSGTYQNIILGGTNQVVGTMVSGFYGTPQITGGTLTSGNVSGGTVAATLSNSGTYQINGTATTTGSFVYVKTVSPGTTFGTVNFVSGLITVFS